MMSKKRFINYHKTQRDKVADKVFTIPTSLLHLTNWIVHAHQNLIFRSRKSQDVSKKNNFQH